MSLNNLYSDSREKAKKLVEQYPKLFDCRSYELSWPRGWDSLVTTAIDKLSKHNAKIVQIKEKYGTLRIYVDRSDDEIFKITEDALHDSMKTCALHGTTDLVHTYTVNYWYIPLSEAAAAELQKDPNNNVIQYD